MKSILNILLVWLTVAVAGAQVPQLINYQGRVAVAGVNFDGTGHFKFALVNASGTTTYWSNDGTGGGGGEPVAAVSLGVAKGLYSVLLGDTTLAHMTAIPATVFNHDDVRLRVWFDDGTPNGSQLLAPDQRIAAVGYALAADTAVTVADGAITTAKFSAGAVDGTHLADGAVSAAHIAPGAVDATRLAGGAVAANLHAAGLAGVASGGMILSTDPGNQNLIDAGFVKLGQTGLGSCAAWDERAGGSPPTARYRHTAVWTGSEMIVWGGDGNSGYLNDGGRFDPASNNWLPLSTVGAPAARVLHTMLWTGSEMIVWGGHGNSGYLNDGGRYNPATNTWTAMNSSGAPSSRSNFVAVWSGSEMLVWGGYASSYTYRTDGGRYNPGSDSWTAMSTTNAPAPRTDCSAVWTGSEMLVWGGTFYDGTNHYFDDGGRYQPAGDSWTPLSTTGAPSARRTTSAVWTGSEMLVWGGFSYDGAYHYLNDGGRYHPGSDSWTPLGTTGAPSGRLNHSAVWTGDRMLVWGGGTADAQFNDGGCYDPAGVLMAAAARRPGSHRSAAAHGGLERQGDARLGRLRRRRQEERWRSL
jgi:N-acetylneuraminic acid mutarotase